MSTIVFGQSDRYPLALLIKGSAFDRAEIERRYLHPLEQAGIDRNDVVVLSLPYPPNGKASATYINEQLRSGLLETLDSLGTRIVYVADASYFKVLAKTKKAEPHLGYVMPCRLEPIARHCHRAIIMGVNHKSLIYSPHKVEQLNLSLKAAAHALSLPLLPRDTDEPIGVFDKQFFTEAYYADGDPVEVDKLLHMAHNHRVLACDIETAGLEVEGAGIGTIAFAWADRAGVAFNCDYTPHVQINPSALQAQPADDTGRYARMRHNDAIRGQLRHFFEHYTGQLIFHNLVFDVKMLIRHLWMQHASDTQGLLDGLNCLMPRSHDTRLMAYLCLNTTGELDLSLKSLGHSHAGNYAVEDIKDILRIPPSLLLRYNLVDAATTLHLYERFNSELDTQFQREIYEQLFLPSQRVICQMELTGLPLDPNRVAQVKSELHAIREANLQVIHASPLIQDVQRLITLREWERDFESRRAKAKNPEKIRPKDRDTYATVAFNPNSNQQLQVLLHDVMGLPVLERTATGQPAVGAGVLMMLKSHTLVAEQLEVLDALLGFASVDKILGTFIAAFERARLRDDDRAYLMGSFLMGGTVSGRMSSSKPNLQNLPSGSQYGKLVKSCVVAPEGWLFVGADFNSLEDYVSALTTKDPNKLRVYEDGYDGHCLRAKAYFGEQMPDIGESVAEINRIKHDYPELRQASKAPTFALTYGGTTYALMQQCGFDEATARKIESDYHRLYSVSDAWVQERLAQAASCGYVTTAFGLRVRTPLLHKSHSGETTVQKERAAEARTAGNALGQGYGLLTNRSMNAFMRAVHDSAFRHAILPVAMIHDASYFLVRDNVHAIDFVNRFLIREMQWQELPEIAHDTVKIGAELDIFYPNWATPITIPNLATQDKIRQICRQAIGLSDPNANPDPTANGERAA